MKERQKKANKGVRNRILSGSGCVTYADSMPRLEKELERLLHATATSIADV